MPRIIRVDAISMPPDGPFVKGREGIKQLSGAAIQQMGLTDLRLNILALEIVGGTAYEVGEGVMTLKSGAVTVKVRGGMEERRWLVAVAPGNLECKELRGRHTGRPGPRRNSSS